MREYGKITPGFWMGPTGKQLRGCSFAQVVAIYLITSPHANMLGLYYLPMPLLVHETGLTAEEAAAGLQRCIDAGYCRYDPESEFVWVIQAALFQVGDEIKETDKRCAGVRNQLNELPENPFKEAFRDHYADVFYRNIVRLDETPKTTPPPSKAPSKPLDNPSKAPSKPLRSQGAVSSEQGAVSREQGAGSRQSVPAPPPPSPAATDLAPWALEELRNLAVTDAQTRSLAQHLGPRLPAALFKLKSKPALNPAGLLVGKAAELAKEGEAMLREQVDRWKALAPKEALSGAQWGALPECLRLDLEVQARWLAWMATKARLDASGEQGRFEAIGEHSVAQRLALEILEARHPERDRIRAEVQEALAGSMSETARRGALMRALGLEPSVPVDLQVMPLAVGAR